MIFQRFPNKVKFNELDLQQRDSIPVEKERQTLVFEIKDSRLLRTTSDH